MIEKKLFKCPTCNKALARKSDLKVHIDRKSCAKKNHSSNKNINSN